MKAPKIFGREPAFIAGLIEAILATLISFGMLGFIGIDGTQGLVVVMAVVNGGVGLYVAYVTKDTLLGVGLALLKAVISLLAYYQYDLSETQAATLIALASLLLGGFQRTQTGPAVLAGFNLSSHSVDVPPEGQVVDTVPALTPAGILVEKPVPPENPPTAPAGDELKQ